jgi:hypothetical protein
MSDILCKLIKVGNDVGKVTSAMMYDSGFMTVEGVKISGKKFSITFSVKEEEEDA